VAALFWIVGGLVCTAGALIYGGLGLLYPQGGGQYIYLRESMGPRYAKFYGWVSMLIICPTMLAGTSLFFTELCQGVVPGIAPVAKAVAIGLIVLFTLFNTIGLKLAGSVQKILVVVRGLQHDHFSNERGRRRRKKREAYRTLGLRDCSCALFGF
jgi:APA family basic amino acid/polyamine antiporter